MSFLPKFKIQTKMKHKISKRTISVQKRKTARKTFLKNFFELLQNYFPILPILKIYFHIKLLDVQLLIVSTHFDHSVCERGRFSQCGSFTNFINQLIYFDSIYIESL